MSKYEDKFYVWPIMARTFIVPLACLLIAFIPSLNELLYVADCGLLVVVFGCLPWVTYSLFFSNREKMPLALCWEKVVAAYICYPVLSCPLCTMAQRHLVASIGAPYTGHDLWDMFMFPVSLFWAATSLQ